LLIIKSVQPFSHALESSEGFSSSNALFLSNGIEFKPVFFQASCLFFLTSIRSFSSSIFSLIFAFSSSS